MFKPLELCREELRGDRTYYVVNPAEMYPLVIDRMLEIRGTPGRVRLPEVVDDNHPEAENNYRKRIRKLPEGALELGLIVRDNVSRTDAPKRAQALGLAWKFFRTVARAAGIKEHGDNKVAHFQLINENSPEPSDFRH